MKKTETTATKAITMASVLEELNEQIKEFNAEQDVVKCAEIEEACKKLVNAYNELSLLHTYANFISAEIPLVELAKAYYYPKKTLKKKVHNEVDADGVAKSTLALVLEDREAKLDVLDFVEWTMTRGTCVAHTSDYKGKVKDARVAVANEWIKFFKSKAKDDVKMSVGKTKKALQAMFDALVFIPCENHTDKNAIIANNDTAKWVLALANTRKDVRLDTGDISIVNTILPQKTWATLVLDILHMAVADKKYEVIFKEDDEEAPTKVEADDEAEAEETTAE